LIKTYAEDEQLILPFKPDSETDSKWVLCKECLSIFGCMTLAWLKLLQVHLRHRMCLLCARHYRGLNPELPFSWQIIINYYHGFFVIAVVKQMGLQLASECIALFLAVHEALSPLLHNLFPWRNL
jgi:hypothetical protein